MRAEGNLGGSCVSESANHDGQSGIRRLIKCGAYSARQRVANESPSIERFPISVSITRAVPERL